MELTNCRNPRGGEARRPSGTTVDGACGFGYLETVALESRYGGHALEAGRIALSIVGSLSLSAAARAGPVLLATMRPLSSQPVRNASAHDRDSSCWRN